MKAITLWPEWAWAITHLGKRVENRGWTFPKSLLGKRILIHAGLGFGGRQTSNLLLISEAFTPVVSSSGCSSLDRFPTHSGYTCLGYDFGYAEERKVELRFADVPRGALVASAVVTSSSKLPEGSGKYIDGTEANDWSASGMFGWQLEDVKALSDPVYCRGFQRLWNVSRDDEISIRIQQPDTR